MFGFVGKQGEKAKTKAAKAKMVLRCAGSSDIKRFQPQVSAAWRTVLLVPHLVPAPLPTPNVVCLCLLSHPDLVLTAM